MALTDKLTAIADAVREKTGGTEEMTLDQMAVAIAGITAGGGGSAGGSGGGRSEWVLLHEVELTEEAAIKITGFDATLSEYVMQLIVPKVSTVVNAGNSSFLGARTFTYYREFGSTGYPTHYTYHATMISGGRMVLVKHEISCNSTGFDNDYSVSVKGTTGSALACNVSRGVDLRGTFPIGTKVRLEGRQ